MRILLIILTSVCFAGCAITANNVENKAASPDNTTPVQYGNIYNAGILGYDIYGQDEHVYLPDLKKGQKLPPVEGVIITESKRQQYNNLINKYKYKLSETESVKLNEDDGVYFDKDKWGNDICLLRAQHVVYFGVMKQWERNGEKPDSTWDATKGWFSSVKDKIEELVSSDPKKE